MVDNIKILTLGKLASEFKSNLSDFSESNNLIIDHIENCNQEQLNKYNSIASFSFPNNLDISHIKWIHSFGAGVDRFANRTDLNKNLILTRTIGKLGEKIAEYCLTHILAKNQNLYEVYEEQENNVWQKYPASQLRDKNIAILGTGEMGRASARLLSKFGCKVIGINTDGHHVNEFKECYSFERFFADPPSVDTLISILPSTKGTSELLTSTLFSGFSDLHFINVGRGNVVSEDTIIEAIKMGHISRATLDVFAEEPLPSSSKLWDNEKVFITPHQASITDINDVIESFQIIFNAIKQNKQNNLFVNLVKGY